MVDNVLQVVIARTHAVEVDRAKLTVPVSEFIFAYGLKQLLNDAGSTGKNPDEKLAMAQKKLAALYEGVVRTAGSGKPGKSPLEAEAYRIAWAMIKAGIIAKGLKVKDFSEEKRDELVARLIAKDESIMNKAREALEAKQAAPTVDLADLMGDDEAEADEAAE